MVAHTILGAKRITLCPTTFDDRLGSLAHLRDADDIDSDIHIDYLQSIGSTLLHEFMHWFWDDFSKSSFNIAFHRTNIYSVRRW